MLRGRNRKGRYSAYQRRMALRFLAPSITALVAVVMLPTVLAFSVAFHRVDLVRTAGRFVPLGWGNFVTLFRDARFANSLLVTLRYTTISIGVQTLAGLSIALLLNRTFRGKGIVRTLIIAPMFVTPVVVGLTWRMFFDPSAGIINYLIGQLGFGGQPDWLGDPGLALPAVIVADVWEWTPFIVLIIMAGLDSIPHELYEAAVVDGAGELQTIRSITLPLLLPALAIAVVLRIVDANKVFDVIYVMTRGGPGLATETTNLYAYTTGFQYFRIGYATTIALVFTLAVTTVLGTIFGRTLRRTARRRAQHRE